MKAILTGKLRKQQYSKRILKWVSEWPGFFFLRHKDYDCFCRNVDGVDVDRHIVEILSTSTDHCRSLVDVDKSLSKPCRRRQVTVEGLSTATRHFRRLVDIDMSLSKACRRRQATAEGLSTSRKGKKKVQQMHTFMKLSTQILCQKLQPFRTNFYPFNTQHKFNQKKTEKY